VADDKGKRGIVFQNASLNQVHNANQKNEKLANESNADRHTSFHLSMERVETNDTDLNSTGISHLTSCPRPAWAFFLTLFLVHGFASPFSVHP
jgi:hypothetical protein